MDLNTATQALEQAFRRDIEDGTLEVVREEGAVVVDGGNWTLTADADETVSLTLPEGDPNYYDEDADQFIENVLNVEVEESLAWADRELGGAIVAGLRSAGDVWSARLAERLMQARV